MAQNKPLVIGSMIVKGILHTTLTTSIIWSEMSLPWKKIATESEYVNTNFRFSVSEVDSEGFDLALVRLPRPAVTREEDDYENVLPVCIDWTGTEASYFGILVRVIHWFHLNSLSLKFDFSLTKYYCGWFLQTLPHLTIVKRLAGQFQRICCRICTLVLGNVLLNHFQWKWISVKCVYVSNTTRYW